MSAGRIVLVGGGQASSVAARTLRRRGYDGEVVLLGDEPVPPYQRPPLSKEYLTDSDESALWLLPEDWVAEHDVQVRCDSRVRRIDTASGSVELADGGRVAADAVLLATGGRPRSLPGVEDSLVRFLRTKQDCDELRASLGPGTRLVVVGAGFIGAEVASSALQLGASVTVLEMADWPLHRVLGQQLGELCAGLQRAAGVDLRLGQPVRAVRERDGELAVVTPGGEVAADVVVAAVGIEPNSEVAIRSGLSVDNGVLVDEHCRTSVPNVYAAGDVANQFHPLVGRHLRVEHFDTASKQASVAAQGMLGRDAVLAEPHWFWSDQFGHNIQCVGHIDPADTTVVRGDPESREFTTFFLRDGTLVAAFALNRAEDVMVARELISARVPMAAEALADPDADLFEALEAV